MGALHLPFFSISTQPDLREQNLECGPQVFQNALGSYTSQLSSAPLPPNQFPQVAGLLDWQNSDLPQLPPPRTMTASELYIKPL